jgi:hypothetical protein
MPLWHLHTFNVLSGKNDDPVKQYQAVNSEQTLVVEASIEKHKTAFSGL